MESIQLNPLALQQIAQGTTDALLKEPERFAAIAYARYALKPNTPWAQTVPPEALLDPTIVAASPILASFDALHGLALLWRAAERKTLPYASAALLRQSMLAGATGAWLFAEPSIRLPQLTCYAIQSKVTALRDLTARATRLGPEASDAHSLTLERATTGWRALCPKHAEQGSGSCKPADTHIWSTGSAIVLGDDADTRDRLKLAWRMLSGDTHGLAWSAEIREHSSSRVPAPGRLADTSNVTMDHTEHANYVQHAVGLARSALRMAIIAGVRVAKI